jgi:pimeloyl-ACP methyl ester carboxylesterase
LSALDIPLLLAYGVEDHKYVRPSNAYLASILRHAKTVAFPDTGHLVNIEEPEHFNAVLAGHIETAKSRTTERAARNPFT